jgi:ABC-type multidrug transport system fused ATPase/permease subunit
LIFYAAAIFITVRMMIDILPVHEGRGNLSRIYFNAIWPFVFAWVFHYFGRPWVLRAGLIAAFLFLLARAAGAVAGWILDVPLYIPGINYVLSFSGRDSLVPMRGVAYNLLLIALIFFHGFRSSVARNAMLPVMAASSWLIVMGASRFTTFLFLVLPVCFFAWTRRWVLLAVATLLSTGAAIYVNVNPRAVDELPPAIARSLSGLEVGKTASEAQAGAEGSNEWHSSLRAEGYKRWTQSPLTFLFGYGVRPSPDLYETKQFSIDPQEVVGIAANTGSYESSLWAVLAILGVVGYAFYFFLSLHFWRKLLPIFLQRPRGTITEGVIFWATYSSVMWFVTGYFQGGFPAMETFLLVLATDVIADQRALARRHESAEVPALPQEVLA